MKKRLFIFLIILGSILKAQQYPWFTQYRSNLYMFNPGFCGTKRMVDARVFYRNQWVGFDGAPKTYALSLNFRYLKGKLGSGLFVFQDNIGPFKTQNISGTIAYHIKMNDVELSFGAQGNYISQTFTGSKVTLHNQIDKSINLSNSTQSNCYDGSAGLVIYNERFYVGAGVNNLIGSEMKYYKGDSFYKGKYKNEPSYSIGVGYNFAEDENYVFENSLMALYTKGAPFYMDYSIRMHIKTAMFCGLSLRLRDAIALHLGVTVRNSLQIGYSYDIVTSPLRKYESGSHEIKLVFSSNFGRDKRKRGTNGRFLNKKFQYLL